MATAKILDLNRLEPLLRAQRTAGKRVVLAGGCFDLFHAGHAAYLQGAKALGDVLAVGLNSDASIARVKPHPPLFAWEQRSAVVAAMADVDCVFAFDDDNLCEAIYRLRPDAFVKGIDYADKTFPEQAAAAQVGCQIAFIGAAKIASSSNMARKLFERYGPKFPK